MSNRTATIEAAISSRPSIAPAPAQEPVAEGLLLSDIIYKPLSFFRLNPENEIFRRLKTEADYADLQRAIETTHDIEPLQAMPDGLLLKGESRLIVAQRMGLDRLPVRLVLSTLAPEKMREILWLDNLARVEIDEATRTWMYAELFPGYFRPAKSDTVSPVSRKEAAEKMGVSERQARRAKVEIERADEIAAGEGRQATPDDVARAKAEVNGKRRESGVKAEAPAIVRVRAAIVTLREWADKEPVTFGGPSVKTAYTEAANLIEEALR